MSSKVSEQSINEVDVCTSNFCNSNQLETHKNWDSFGNKELRSSDHTLNDQVIIQFNKFCVFS